jgi:hypothetical protein
LDDGTTWVGRIYDEHGRALLAERGTRVSIAPDGRRWSDAFAQPADLLSHLKRGDWNTYRIVGKGPHMEVWLNGVLASTLDDHQMDAADYAGKIALQLHSGRGPVKVQFRNLRLAQLGRTEMPATAPTLSRGGNVSMNSTLEKSALPAVHGGDPLRPTQSPVLWHLRPNPAGPSRVENPAAQQLVSGMLLTHGFKAELIAAEPDVHQPIAFAIDERGRLWVVEAHSYPAKQPAGGKGSQDQVDRTIPALRRLSGGRR